MRAIQWITARKFFREELKHCTRKASQIAENRRLRVPDYCQACIKCKTKECVRDVQALYVLEGQVGATAIEYGLIAAGISVVIIATVNAIGTSLNGKFNQISTQLK